MTSDRELQELLGGEIFSSASFFIPIVKCKACIHEATVRRLDPLEEVIHNLIRVTPGGLSISEVCDLTGLQHQMIIPSITALKQACAVIEQDGVLECGSRSDEIFKSNELSQEIQPKSLEFTVDPLRQDFAEDDSLVHDNVECEITSSLIDGELRNLTERAKEFVQKEVSRQVDDPNSPVIKFDSVDCIRTSYKKISAYYFLMESDDFWKVECVDTTTKEKRPDVRLRFENKLVPLLDKLLVAEEQEKIKSADKSTDSKAGIISDKPSKYLEGELEKDRLKSKLRSMEEKNAELKKMLLEVKSHVSETLDARQSKERAASLISNAQNEIICFFPFITEQALSHFSNEITSALSRDVHFTIMWGIHQERNPQIQRDRKQLERSKQALSSLEKLVKSKGEGLVRLTFFHESMNDHRKIILVDRTKLLVGSHNLFSYSGATTGPRMRKEQMEYFEQVPIGKVNPYIQEVESTQKIPHSSLNDWTSQREIWTRNLRVSTSKKLIEQLSKTWISNEEHEALDALNQAFLGAKMFVKSHPQSVESMSKALSGLKAILASKIGVPNKITEFDVTL